MIKKGIDWHCKIWNELYFLSFFKGENVLLLVWFFWLCLTNKTDDEKKKKLTAPAYYNNMNRVWFQLTGHGPSLHGLKGEWSTITQWRWKSNTVICISGALRNLEFWLAGGGDHFTNWLDVVGLTSELSTRTCCWGERARKEGLDAWWIRNVSLDWGSWGIENRQMQRFKSKRKVYKRWTYVNQEKEA